MKLEDIRLRIDDLDSKLLEIINKRMQLSLEVAKNKIETDSEIYSSQREADILQKIDGIDNIHHQESKTIMQSIMTMSRQLQYEKILKSGMKWALGNEINQARVKLVEYERIAYGGKEGSYSEQAAREIFPYAKVIKGYKSFNDACLAVVSGEMDAVVLPLENTTAGTVNEVYDLIPKNNLYIIKSISKKIEHYLLTLKRAKITDVKSVISHYQALNQCTEIIKKYNWRAIESLNTAYAAEEVIARDDKSIAAIGSKILADNSTLIAQQISVNDEGCNQTRFIALSKELIIEENANRVSIAFKLPHKTGALAWVLFMFGGLNINLTKIQSRPITNRPWEYIFYVDFTYEDEDKALQILYQLEKELPEIKLLGWY